MILKEDILKTEEEKIDKLLSMNYLTPDNCKFYKTAGGFAGLILDDKDYGHINVICTFPFTCPQEYISVREIDGKKNELGIIEKLSVFDADTQKLLNDQIHLRYFMPKISKILSIKEEYGHAYWTVITDKGKCKFTSSAGSGGSVTQLGNRVIIKDSSENRYEIEDISKLSTKEIKKLDLYL